MKVKRLVLKNFRNYSELSWFPHPCLNIVAGNNAQGKTNLLEAIFFCTAGRSFRTTRERDMIGWSGKDCFAGVTLEKNNSSLEISVSLNEKGRTAFFMNGTRQVKSRIYRPAMAVSFTPSDTELIRGSPVERRKWMDLELGPFDPGYPYNLAKFEKVINHRNILLRNSGRQNQADLLEPWNEQMVLYGSRIISARIRLLKALFPHIRAAHAVLTAGKEEVSYRYLSTVPLEKGAGPEDLPGLYEETVRKKSGLEVERQQSLFGPHRDDITFLVNGAEVRKFGSRGQQRSVVLALKISLMKMYYEETGEYPLLLLDDVFLELDRDRQRGLENLLAGEAQVFITSDRDLAGYFGGQAGTYNIVEGKLHGGEE
ncbi:MAG: DNA replication/repair protein RecF [Peptococcaceae bacterium]|nr:DNA replication/repair protein RecF [Peptococcaceae bacterium]